MVGAEEIAAAAESSGADAIVLSLVYPMPDPRLHEEIRRLRGLVRNDVLLVAGGRAAQAMSEELMASGVAVVGDLDELAQTLDDRNY